jgi:hypothetical protein
MYRVKPVGCLFLGLLFLTGCRASHDAAVSAFRVLDAPANYVRRHIDGSAQTQTTTTTTTTARSDVTTPGRTVTPTTTEAQRRTTTQNQPRSNPQPTAAPRSSPPVVTEKSKPSTPPSTQGQYPTAKPVPGKPGYVFSPFDPSGGYVDVNGYSPGQKVKDPYSGKIFLVP